MEENDILKQDIFQGIFIIRICLHPLRNPMTIENLQIFTTFEEAYEKIKRHMEKNKLIQSTNTQFNEHNRYYVYENFIEEEFIWIEKHTIKV
jgi:hypothetical protein